MSPEQRREADVNIEFAGSSKFAAEAAEMAWYFRRSNDKYATDYPAAVGDRMSNTDSGSFQDLCPAISLRENERLSQTGTGWNPTWHQPIDVYSTFSDKDFRLGLERRADDTERGGDAVRREAEVANRSSRAFVASASRGGRARGLQFYNHRRVARAVRLAYPAA